MPIENGHVNYHKCYAFPVGGKHIDFVFRQSCINNLDAIHRENKFFDYDLRREIKEKIIERIKSNKTYELPDKKILIKESDNYL